MKHIGFGAGSALLDLKSDFVRGLFYLVDNHPQKQGRKINDLEIRNPSVLLEEDKEKIFIWILSQAHGASISLQLKEMGFVEGRHFINIFDLLKNNEIPELYGKGSVMKLAAPKIIRHDGLSRLACEFDDNGETIELWFEVDNKYEQYLLYERSDAFLICLLWYAMRTGRDIECVAPVTEELLYNIETLLIPSLVKHSKLRLYPTKIHCVTESEKLESAGCVGTGLSLGVDSFHAVQKLLNSKYRSMALTHLCIFNTPVSYTAAMGVKVEDVRQKRFKLAEKAAEEIGLSLVKINSNLSSALLMPHGDANTMINLSPIVALKKMWKTYYYASTFNISMFSIGRGNGFNDLFMAHCFSDSDMRIYIEGIEKTRPEKVADIADFDIARKYLHVCGFADANCNLCSQCKRTMIEFEMAGKLDHFRDAFDVDYYLEHRVEYYKSLCESYRSGDAHAREVIEYMLENPDKILR